MEFVTDRQYSDIGQNSKGSYNISDFLRVNTNVENLVESVGNVVGEIKNRLKEFDVASDVNYNFPFNTQISIVKMPKYAYNSIPTAEELTNYLENVENLANNFEIQHNLPKTMENLNIDGANAIEKSLENVYNVINETKDIIFSKIDRTVWEYTGDFYEGEL